jgi:hypothetical protein
MSDPIKDLQLQLVQDLIKFEDSGIINQQLLMIEEVYKRVYNLLGSLDSKYTS